MTTPCDKPIPPEVTSLLFFRCREDAESWQNKIPQLPGGLSPIQTTYPPPEDDCCWKRKNASNFSRAELVCFCVEPGDDDFLRFANEAAPGIRVVRIVQFPTGIASADLSFDDLRKFIREAKNYETAAPGDRVSGEALRNKVRDHEGVKRSNGPNNQEPSKPSTKPAQPQAEDDKNPSFLKRKKIKSIESYRQWCKREERKPYTYVGSWAKAAIESAKLSISEFGVLSIIKAFLNSPYALECWPGEKAIEKSTSSARSSWLRNRDSLEQKGWIIVERFGSGTSPIIYPVKPGEKCPSKFAPREGKESDEDDTS